MSSNVAHSDGHSAGLPFARPIVRRITEELFHEQSQWKSGELVDHIVKMHRDRGGSTTSNPGMAVRRVLQDLRNEGLEIAPGHGWWRWTGSTTDGRSLEEAPADGMAPVDDLVDDLEPLIRIERETGDGSECVYLYFNPNDHRLAELEGRDVWECTIGRTASCDAINRIFGQGIRTALSRLPTVGLVLRTDDAASLENALHASLRLVGAEVPDSPGNEWFVTSPTRVEAWYAIFQDGLVKLKPGKI